MVARTTCSDVLGPGVMLIRKPEAQAADSHGPLNDEVDYVMLERRTAGLARQKDFVLGLASRRRPDRVQGSRPCGM